jgi:hypothetical protein
VCLCPLDELITNIFGEVDEADLIRAGTFVNIFFLVFDHLMADDHALEKLIELRMFSQALYILFDVFSLVDLVHDGDFLEDHLVSSEGACFVSEDIGYDAEFLEDGAVEDPAAAFGVCVFHFSVEGEEDAGEGLDAFDEDDEGDGDEVVEEDEDAEEGEAGCVEKRIP